ncbi:MAG: hypothetical protein NT178_15850 [Proteobacteria bacterium]|nr:hypothetical protein [Pseudomonadota bacterium]
MALQTRIIDYHFRPFEWQLAGDDPFLYRYVEKPMTKPTMIAL